MITIRNPFQSFCGNNEHFVRVCTYILPPVLRLLRKYYYTNFKSDWLRYLMKNTAGVTEILSWRIYKSINFKQHQQQNPFLVILNDTFIFISFSSLAFKMFSIGFNCWVIVAEKKDIFKINRLTDVFLSC